VSILQCLQNQKLHENRLCAESEEIWNIQTGRWGAASCNNTHCIWHTFCILGTFGVKENHFADALPVTLIEFDLPSHHLQPTEKASSIDALTFLASPFMSWLLAAQKTCF
jgi:hypothetical protein